VILVDQSLYLCGNKVFRRWASGSGGTEVGGG